jgi:hypothetical protein
MGIELIPEIFEKVFGGKENRCEREVRSGVEWRWALVAQPRAVVLPNAVLYFPRWVNPLLKLYGRVVNSLLE